MDMYDVKVLQDEVRDGVRIIYAQTCDMVCSKQVAVAVKDGIVVDAGFMGGCQGNTTGIAALVRGMKVEDAIARLEGINCGGKGTSCPDQLARTLKLTL